MLSLHRPNQGFRKLLGATLPQHVTPTPNQSIQTKLNKTIFMIISEVILCRLFTSYYLHEYLLKINLTDHCNELWKLELEVDSDGLRYVCHGPDQLVVVAEQVVVQSLGVRVPSQAWTRKCLLRKQWTICIMLQYAPQSYLAVVKYSSVVYPFWPKSSVNRTGNGNPFNWVQCSAIEVIRDYRGQWREEGGREAAKSSEIPNLKTKQKIQSTKLTKGRFQKLSVYFL